MNQLFKHTRKLFFLFLLPFLTLSSIQAQTTIWSQNFTGLTEGETGPVASGVISTANNMGWNSSTTIVNQYAQVRTNANNDIGNGEVFEIRNATATWTSAALDIAGHSDISLSVLLNENGNLDDADGFDVYYYLDGGPRQDFTVNNTQFEDFNAGLTATANNLATSGLAGSTIVIEVVIHTDSNGEYINIDNITVVSNQSLNITNTLSACVDISGGDFIFDVDYNAAGTFNGGNEFNVQLSDAAGVFAAVPPVIGTLVSTISSGTISATIPAATPLGTGYRIRVTSTDAPITGADNGTDITIFDDQSIDVAPTGSQVVASNSTGAAITATPNNGTSGNIQWGYRTVPFGAITNFAPAETGISYTPDGTDFPGTGTYYMVAQTQACGTGSYLVVSNEVEVTIVSPLAFNQIGGNVFADDNNDGIRTLPADVGEANVTVNLYEDTNNDGVLDAGDLLLGTTLTDADGDYNFDVTTSTCVRIGDNGGSGDDDVEDDVDGGNMSRGSSDLELITESENQIIGLLFRGLTIPNGATITSSAITFRSRGSFDSETLDFNIVGETVAGATPTNPNDFPDTNGNLLTRPFTTAVTPWEILANAEDWADNEYIQTPSVNDIITEITSASSWASGNNLVLMINRDGAGSGTRIVDSYDVNSGNDAPLLCVTYVTGNNYLVQVDRTDLPPDHVLTTSSETLYVTAANVTAGTAQDNNFGYSLDDNTIVNFTDVCMDISGGAYAFTVDYELAGPPNYNGGNTLTLQLSNTSGSFTDAVPLEIGSLVTTLASGTIAASIPFGTAVGSNYRIRIVSDAPAINGSDNGTDIRIFDDVSISITPTSAQAFAINTIGAVVTAAPSAGTSGDIQWGYRSTSLGAITNFAPPETNTNYTPAGADFPGEGTFFLVAMTQPCAGGAYSVISNEVEITITSPTVLIPNIISGNVFFDVNASGNNDAGDLAESGTTVSLYEDTNGNGSIDGGDLLLETTTSDGSGDYSFSILSSTCVRINSDNDDTEEYINSGNSDRTSSDLELLYDDDSSDPDDEQAIGLLFRSVNVPNGATITSSGLTFVSDNNSGAGDLNLIIQGESSANPSNFDSSNGDITSRTPTTASTSWTLSNSVADSWSNNQVVYSPSVNGIISEITSLGGWTAGDNMVIMINHGGTSVGDRRVDSYDTDGGANAPLLCIEYISGADYIIQVDRTGFPSGHTMTTSEEIPVISANAISGVAQNVNFGYTNIDNNITNFTDVCMDISGGDFNFTVDYFLSGGTSYGVGNDLTLQLSNTTGGFVGATDLVTVTTSSATGTIAAAIPAATPVGDQYRIRINSTNPVEFGSDNGTDIRIFDDASLSIAPTGDQTFTTAGTGALLTSTAGAGTSGNIQWAYRTVSSGATVNFAPAIVTDDYTPAGADFPSAGTYYLVATTQPCSTASYTIISNEVEIVITNLANTITSTIPECIDVSTASVTFDVTYDGGGGYADPNTLEIQLSDGTGDFTGAIAIGSSTSTFSSGTISVTIPMGQAFGDGYLMRLVSTNPAFTGADNGNDITIFNEPNITVAPLSSQSFDNLSSGVAVTATTGNGTSGVVRWYYRTVPGGTLNDFTPVQTGNTYTPNALNFPGTGTYYLVAATIPCGTVLYNAISTEIEIEITTAPNSISGKVFLDLNADGNQNFNDKGQAAVRVNLYEDINNNGVVDGGDVLKSTVLSDAVGNYSFSAGAIGLCTQVSGDDDDAEQNQDDTGFDIDSSDLELVNDGGGAGDNQNIGMLFRNIAIPAGATITSAYLEFVVDENQDPQTTVLIAAHDVDNPGDFTGVDVNSRPLTTATGTWVIPASEDWTENDVVTSVDISNVINEIITRPGWNSGQNIAIILGGTSAGQGRTVESHDGESGSAPRLCVTISGQNYLVEVEPVDLGPGAIITTTGTYVVSGAAAALGSSNNHFGYDGETTGCYAIADGGDDEFEDALYIINRFTGENYWVGENNVGDIEAMAIDVFNDKVYATNGGTLGSIDPLTGVWTAIGAGVGDVDGSVGTVTITDIDGLTMDPFAGILYGSNRMGGQDIFFQIDINTGLAIQDAYGAGVDYVEITGAGVGADIDDFMINPFSGIMYAANSSGSTYSSQLVTINYKNPGAGEATLVGSFDGETDPNLDVNYDIEGIGSSDCGAVYVTSGGGGVIGNNLMSVNTGTGLATSIGTFVEGDDFESSDCLFAPANRIIGTAIDDVNGNGVQDGGEGGLNNVTVSLYNDANDNGTVDAGEQLLQQTATDATGEYIFKVAGVVGNFVVQIDESTYPADYVATTPDENDESYEACSLGTDYPGNNFGARSANILPITLVRFTAKLNDDNDVLLEWVTANETDNAFFTIERSRDWQDPTTFTPILTVDGNGTTYTQNKYSAVDYELLEGVYYYRLKQTDIDGQFTYSKIVAIEIKGGTQEKEVTLFPNPLGNQNLNFKLKGFAPNQNFNVLIYDMTGRLTFTKEVNILANLVEIPVQEHQLSAGAYIVRIVSGEETFYKKLIVNK
jgi:hypothetical protein